MTLRRLAAAVALCLAAAAPALASEILKLRNGDLVPGEVVEMDDASVLFAREDGGRVRVGWAEVLPISRYELWAASLAPEDTAGRLALAEWALGEGLFHQARKEALKAKGAGGAGSEAADALLAAVTKGEADAALAEIDRRVEAGDPAGALERARAYLRVAPPGTEADRVRGRVPDLLVRIEQAEAEAKEKADQEARDRESAKRQAWVDENLARALELKRNAGETAIEAYAFLAKGNQTRARRALAAAEKGFVEARAILKRVERAVGPGEVADQCRREMQDADRRTVDLLTRWGSLEVDNKAWKRADDVVDRGLRVDPVDRALLDLRRKIDENWIRRRASEITNATGRQSSN